MRNLNKKKIALLTACVVSAVGHMAFAAEADNQDKLDKFLAGALSEEDFLATARPWPNYRTDYAPLVNFAKEKKMPVVAANVPRFLAAHVAKNNASTEGVEAQYQQWLPKHT